jgi:hypothetical protein
VAATNGSAARLCAAAARLAGMAAAGMAAAGANGAVLPDDLAESMGHAYSGGGVTAWGPALLVRKKFAESASVFGSYYVDTVSGASIDVVTTASPYHEKRTEFSGGVDYVYREALLSVSTTRSNEPDYKAGRTNIDIAQDVFGGMTTVSLGYTRGHDTVGKHNEPAFSAAANHWQYRLGLTQILTPNWLASANYEAISDEGYLGSPYRVARVFGASVPERDPNARSSRAAAFRVNGYIEPRSAVRGEYRRFWDNWGVRANTLELGYSRYIGDDWLLDGYGRYYSQGDALFYSDNFGTAMTYMSRNRQLSKFKSYALGGKVTWTAFRDPGRFEVKLNGALEYLRFKYSDFTDLRTGNPYTFDAAVAETSISILF